MRNITTFYGEPLDFWIELKRQSEEMNFCHLIKEIAELRSKVNFYESRIKELSKFMEIKGTE